MIVPNHFPSQSSTLKLAIIGEAPGADEDRLGRPFCGPSGRFLAALLSRAGISIDACFLGNVSQHRPVNNDISTLQWQGHEIQSGLAQLKKDLSVFQPNICVLLGNTALKAAKDLAPHPLKPNAFRYKTSNWRGSLFVCNEAGSPFQSLKCIPSLHPAYCLRDYESSPLLQFDLRKAVREAASSVLLLPDRTFDVSASTESLCELLRDLRRRRATIAIDIEGGIDSMSCISFAESPSKAFIVPFYNKQGQYLSTVNVWHELALTLEDPYVPKILQNSLYDRFVLHFSYGIRVRGVMDDTMLKHWELYSELEKSLGVQASIYTDEPYYKGERKSDDDKTFYEYCCRDSAITLEISNKLGNIVQGLSNDHYQFNMAMLNPILYMELRGIRYDAGGAKQRRSVLLDKCHEAQAKLNALTGHGFSWKNIREIKQYAQTIFYTKKGDRVRKEYEAAAPRLVQLFLAASPTIATIGEIEDLCEVSLNVNSKNQFQDFLYKTLALPTQMSKVRGKAPHVTTDDEAMLNLSRFCLQNDKQEAHTIVQLCREIRGIKTRVSNMESPCDSDGRMRFSYNLVGSDTGRVQCQISPTGNGRAGQGIPGYETIEEAPGGILGDQDLFLADNENWLFKCDLKGADGWTVAAYCKLLGDDGMLLDYLADIKPYARLALKIDGRPEAEWKDRIELSAFLKTYKLGGNQKLTAKRVQHGGAYLEGGLTISRNVLKDSDGKLYITPKEGDALKTWYMNQYWGIKRWHDWLGRRLYQSPFLTAASGQTRQFFGRPEEILTKAVAFEPQANTTYATNLAAFRLWSDNENRIGSENPIILDGTQPRRGACRLRCEPLHQVHDALLGQFKKTENDWAIKKIRTWFANPLTIAGQQITIPFDGAYGRSWGELTEGKI